MVPVLICSREERSLAILSLRLSMFVLPESASVVVLNESLETGGLVKARLRSVVSASEGLLTMEWLFSDGSGGSRSLSVPFGCSDRT